MPPSSAVLSELVRVHLPLAKSAAGGHARSLPAASCR